MTCACSRLHHCTVAAASCDLWPVAAVNMRLGKSHKSTVCVIPPLAVQQAVQSIRCFKDKSFVRWPPHINLLYPFIEDQGSAFANAATAAAGALAQVQPFKIHLNSLSYFEHGSSCTLWMDAADKSGLIAVQSALQAAFPSCNDLSDDPQRGITSFTPHLSLGQWRNKQQLQAALQEYSSDPQRLDLQFEVKEVCICSRQGYRDPFTVRYAVPLGTATPSAPYAHPQLVNVPYIATTTRDLPTLLGLSDSPTDPLRFGLGGAASGVWNFAFGANMSPKKLGGSRGLHPQESRPGVLPGYRLAFTHRGGFGTIVPVAAAATADGAGLTAAGAEAVAGLMGDAEAGATSAAEAEAVVAAGAPGDVHGLLHKLSPADMSDLMCMEHEYEPVVVMVQTFHSQQQQQQQQQQQEEGAESDSHQQQLVPVIAFQSPPGRLIQDGLPPERRYLDLLREGAQHWKLNQQYTSGLQQHPGLTDRSDRGPEYYASPTGQPLPAWPKIRTGGSQQQNSRQRGGRGGTGGRCGEGGRGKRKDAPAQ